MDSAIAEATGSMVNTIHVPNNQYFGNYRGTVLKNDDPENRGRCKIYVRGIYPEKFTENEAALIPWAEPCQPLFCGGSGTAFNNGTFQCPDLNSTVWLFFESGDITRPVFFGQTTDKDGLFSNDICKIYWEGMYVELEKSTKTITASATNITAIAEKIMNGYCETLNATSITANVSSSLLNVTSELINVSSATFNLTSNIINMYGETLIDGNVSISKNLTVGADVSVGGSETVASDSVIGGKSFLLHMHTVNPGDTTSPVI